MPNQGVNTVNVIKLTSGTTVGADGSASNRVTTPDIVNGKIVGIHVTYQSGTPATTTIAIGDSTGTGSQNILTLANKTDNGWFYPQLLPCNTSGTLLGTNIITSPFVNSPITMTVTSVNSASTYTIRILYT